MNLSLEQKIKLAVWCGSAIEYTAYHNLNIECETTSLEFLCKYELKNENLYPILYDKTLGNLKEDSTQQFLDNINKLIEEIMVI